MLIPDMLIPKLAGLYTLLKRPGSKDDYIFQRTSIGSILKLRQLIHCILLFPYIRSKIYYFYHRMLPPSDRADISHTQHFTYTTYYIPIVTQLSKAVSMNMQISGRICAIAVTITLL